MKKTLLVVIVSALFIMLLSACSVNPGPAPSLSPVTDKGPIYTNEWLGMTMTFPEGLTMLDQEEIQEKSAKTIEMLKDKYKDPDAFEKASQENVPDVLVYMHPQDYKGNNPNLCLFVLDAKPSDTADIMSFARAFVQNMSPTQDITFVESGEVHPVWVGGISAATIDVKRVVAGIDLIQRLYFVGHNNSLIVISMSTASDDLAALDILQKAVDNVRFK